MSLKKYYYYERSTQSPDYHITWLRQAYEELRGQPARHLREDFCGTFLLSCEWVRQHDQNTALGLDLDPEPLLYGKKHHFSKLTQNQKERLKLVQQDVLIPTLKKDLIIACNFSFNVFKTRELLVKYFKACLKSLNKKGVLVCEMAGGPGMIKTFKEKKTIKDPKEKFQYIWDQKSFDPITHDAQYAIHFKLPDGKLLKDAFEYDWRLWSIPEVTDALIDAGFSEARVYWESSHQGETTGEYALTTRGSNDYAWIAQIVGLK